MNALGWIIWIAWIVAIVAIWLPEFAPTTAQRIREWASYV